MAVSTSTLYIVTGRTSSFGGTMPSGYQASFNQSVSSTSGSNALALDNVIQAGQKEISNTFSSILTGTNEDLGMAQFVSPAFSGPVSIDASAWTINFAMMVSNAAANFTWTGKAALHLFNGTGVSAGTNKQTLFALQNIGTTDRTTTNEVVVRGTTLSNNAGTAAEGDYLVLEIGVNINNTSGGSLAPTVILYGDGITANNTDTTTVSNHQSNIVSPTTLTLYPGGKLGGTEQLEPVLQTRGPGSVRSDEPAIQNVEAHFFGTDIYRMRGYDSVLARTVYWTAGKPDMNGQQYGGPGVLSDIVVVDVISNRD